MQRELGRLIEHLYQNDVPHDDTLQVLICQAFDNAQQLQQHVREDFFPQPMIEHNVQTTES